ncbi:SCP-like protein, partial [Ancylostoma duodenale]
MKVKGPVMWSSGRPFQALLVTPNYSFDEVTEDCGPDMSMKSRKLLLYWHNWYRSIAAKGEYKIAEKNSKLKMLPPATRMLQLKYNCSLEKSSLEWARTVQCKLVHSETNVGENLYICFPEIPLEEASDDATKPWANEITDLGMSDLSDWGGGKGHASQVLWDTTESVGCGTIHCNNPGTMVVCQYYPAGNMMDYYGKREPMYKAGDTLSDCGKGGRKE